MQALDAPILRLVRTPLLDGWLWMRRQTGLHSPHRFGPLRERSRLWYEASLGPAAAANEAMLRPVAWRLALEDTPDEMAFTAQNWSAAGIQQALERGRCECEP